MVGTQGQISAAGWWVWVGIRVSLGDAWQPLRLLHKQQITLQQFSDWDTRYHLTQFLKSSSQKEKIIKLRSFFFEYIKKRVNVKRQNQVLRNSFFCFWLKVLQALKHSSTKSRLLFLHKCSSYTIISFVLSILFSQVSINQILKHFCILALYHFVLNLIKLKNTCNFEAHFLVLYQCAIFFMVSLALFYLDLRQDILMILSILHFFQRSKIDILNISLSSPNSLTKITFLQSQISVISFVPLTTTTLIADCIIKIGEMTSLQCHNLNVQIGLILLDVWHMSFILLIAI